MDNILTTKLTTLSGIGEQRAKVFARLDLETFGDLLGYFPRRYDDRRQVQDIAMLCNGDTACICATVISPPQLSFARNKIDLVKFRVADETGTMDITFFNQSWLKNTFKIGSTFVFHGKCEALGNLRSMTSPVWESPDNQEQTGRMVPRYSLTAGLSNLMMMRAAAQILPQCQSAICDIFDPTFRTQYDLCDSAYAHAHIHFPDSPETLDIARRRLAFEELFLFTLGLGRLRGRREQVEVIPCHPIDMDGFYNALPFTLTNAQRRSVEEALDDCCSGRPMNRLCQGDVGSGKTMVAAACVYFMAQNGRQSAMMAPTEILAQQHFNGLSPLLQSLGIPCALLTGSMTAKEKRTLVAQLKAGDIQFVVGTHALISTAVGFEDLGLVITDEQHRFGVEQRSALSAKGNHPHTLVMSATPIPRTLALMLYGDLEVSIIDELPPGRQPIKTNLVDTRYRQRIYTFLDAHMAEGRQAYIVCPSVEENEENENDPSGKKAVTQYGKTLQEEVFPNRRIGIVHGKLKSKEKEAVMSAFSAGELDILVATTVIEVGVDVPNAVVMVIENAEQFGLSQLHQLRGRVGRGKDASFCVLISDNFNPDTRQRLQVMTQTTDGFRIAQEDLQLRGPGDFFGQRQHGLAQLKVASLGCDTMLLQQAQQAARALLEADPLLEQHPLIAAAVEALFAQADSTLN